MADGPVTPTPTPLPGWLGPIVQVTTQVGVPTVFAGILLWFVLTQVGTALNTIQKAEDDRIKTVLEMQKSLVDALDHLADRFELSIKENIEVNKELAERYHGGRLRERAPAN